MGTLPQYNPHFLWTCKKASNTMTKGLPFMVNCAESNRHSRHCQVVFQVRLERGVCCIRQESLSMERIPQREKILRPRQVRRANSAALLELLQRHERLSRAELARYSGLSEGTVSRIVTDLIRRKLVMEDGQENSTGGRPATCLRLEQNRFAVGADIHSWETQFGIGTMRGRMVEMASARTPRDPEAALDLIAGQFTAWRDQYGGSHLEGLGVSVRGIVNSRTGVVELGGDPGWVDVPVKELLEARLSTPVYVENNVRAAARDS